MTLPKRISASVMDIALAEMKRRRETILNPEHLLVAVASVSALRNRQIDVALIRQQVDALPGLPPRKPLDQDGVNEATSVTLLRAAARADARGPEPATASDVLYALLDETDGPTFAAALLRECGVNPEDVRHELDAGDSGPS